MHWPVVFDRTAGFFFTMLKKLSLIFIKISSTILAVDLFLKLMLIYFPINLLWIEVIDVLSKLILCIGFVILSHTFKYCGYHRSLFYIILIGNIIYLFYLFINLDIIMIITLLIMSIIITFFIIFTYLKYGRNKETSSRKQSNIKGD